MNEEQELPKDARGYACWAIVHDSYFRERYVINMPERYAKLQTFTSRNFNTIPYTKKWWSFIGMHFWGHHLTTDEDRNAIVEEFLLWRKLSTGAGTKSARSN